MGLVVGLTGGIGSGKSAATQRFQQLGAGIVDTDAIAHALTAPGGIAIPAIVDVFGADYLAPDGALDRERMRARAFSDPPARRRLEAILHPLIREEVARRVAASATPYVIVVIPLLFETGGYPGLLQRIAVVDCSEQTQVARTMSRGKMRREEVQAIIAVQASRTARLAGADDVIDNEGDLAQLTSAVRMLHQRYLQLARQPQPAPQ
jgi:dephospho-CoA kinase